MARLFLLLVLAQVAFGDQPPALSSLGNEVPALSSLGNELPDISTILAAQAEAMESFKTEPILKLYKACASTLCMQHKACFKCAEIYLKGSEDEAYASYDLAAAICGANHPASINAVGQKCFSFIHALYDKTA